MTWWHHVTSCDISRLTTSDFQARFRDKLSQMSRPWQARQRPMNSKDVTGADWSMRKPMMCCFVKATLCSLNNSLGRSSPSTDMQRSTRTCRVDQVKTCRFNGQSCVKRIGSCLHPWSLLFCALLWLSLFDILLEWIFSMIIVIYCDYHDGIKHIKHNLTMFSCHCSVSLMLGGRSLWKPWCWRRPSSSHSECFWHIIVNGFIALS